MRRKTVQIALKISHHEFRADSLEFLQESDNYINELLENELLLRTEIEALKVHRSSNDKRNTSGKNGQQPHWRCCRGSIGCTRIALRSIA